MFHIKRAFEAYIDGFQEITMIIPKSNKQTEHTYFNLVHEHNQNRLPVISRVEFESFIKYTVHSPNTLLLDQSYEIEDEFGFRTDLQVGGVIHSTEFDEKYAYEGNDLGATYTTDSTVYKVWAPTASKVKLRVYLLTDEKEKYTEFQMDRKSNGVWEFILNEDCEGYVYTFLVCVNLIWREAVDPYAKAVTVNGKHGVVVDLSKTIKVKKATSPSLERYTDCIIYEASIRDFTSHPLSGVQKKGCYEGFFETGTTFNNMPTGFDYVRSLGVTHIELLPIFDFEGVDELNPFQSYNWGYNPLNFNAPEGSYSQEPKDPYVRINELKTLISTYHNAGLRIIMDVVYNHVYDLQTSHFERIVPGYYFRQNENGLPSNGTGVGNDFASERLMARRYILHSLIYWTKEYDLDGFRFDLMGILDTTTMNQIEEELFSLKSDLILFGEGWDLNTSLDPTQKASIHQSHKLKKIGFFNDKFRDGMKGSTFSIIEFGFVQGKRNNDSFDDLLTGSFGEFNHLSLFNHPYQSINYVESHDNHTMWDRLQLSNPNESEDILKKRHLLGTSLVLLSYGVPFIHCGQEFFRTKMGIENSYNAGDTINSIDWARAEREKNAISVIKDLISIRKRFKSLRFSLKEEIQAHVKPINLHQDIIGYQVSDINEIDGVQGIMVLFHNGTNDMKIAMNREESGWVYLWDGKKKYDTEQKVVDHNQLNIPALSTVIIVKY
ncbi:type I pullulanase [Gottfriedia solisilvae]|uniref:type I pullulanase n=1 Tax=Gottfriedia solisilvae TaxID=1516104 RepID=UPI003D2F4E34